MIRILHPFRRFFLCLLAALIFALPAIEACARSFPVVSGLASTESESRDRSDDTQNPIGETESSGAGEKQESEKDFEADEKFIADAGWGMPDFRNSGTLFLHQHLRDIQHYPPAVSPPPERI